MEPKELDLTYNRLQTYIKQSAPHIREKVKYCERTMPPRGEGDQVYASVSAVRMQTLDETFPGILHNATTIYDPCCGAGGFIQYCAWRKRNYNDCVYAYNTLMKEGHSVPLINTFSANSKMQCVNILPENSDGDFRHVTVYEAYQHLGQCDLMIIDCGEGTTSSAYTSWLCAARAGHRNIDAIKSFNALVAEGGSLVLRVVGAKTISNSLLLYLANFYSKVDAYKPPTSPLTSLEWYCVFRNKVPEGDGIDARTMSLFIGTVIFSLDDLVHRALYYFRNIHRIREPEHRYDWFMYEDQPSMVHQSKILVRNRELMWDNENSLKVKNDTITFKTNVEERLRNIKNELKCINGKRLDILPVTRQWDRLLGIGTYRSKKQRFDKEKTCVNSYIGDYVYDVLGQDSSVSTYGFTQGTEEAIRESYKKRFDVLSNVPEKKYFDIFVRAMTACRTDYGRSLLGKCRLLTKDETFAMLNKQGATDIFSKQPNIKEFCLAFPNWYEIAIETRIRKWMNGETTAARQVIRYKKESKKRKDMTDEGVLLHEQGESRDSLLKSSYMVPRQIQFSDEITRIAHVILLGDVIRKHQARKTYHGSINGTPVHIQGRVLRTVMESRRRKAMSYEWQNAMDLVAEYTTTNDQEEVIPISLDFSGFDSTVTIQERMLEAHDICENYPPDLHTAIKSAVNEMGYPIIFNDYGEVVMREGQRGSGEIWTSYGNTKLVVCHIATSMSIILGVNVEDFFKPIGHVAYKYNNAPIIDLDDAAEDLAVNYVNGTSLKHFDILPEPILADGDDVVIFTTRKKAQILQRLFPEILKQGMKVIRSGTTSGCTLYKNFNEVEFCSHNYECVLVSPNGPLERTYLNEQDMFRMVNIDFSLKIYYLPTRSNAFIMGKMPNTLKVITSNYDENNEEALEITRGKILSYLLLYPHMRVVRTACLTMLAGLSPGDYKMRGKTTSKMKSLMTTVKGAFRSLYNIDDLDRMSCINYRTEIDQLKVIRRNTKLIGKNTPVRIVDFTNSSCEWLRRRINNNFLTNLEVLHVYPSLCSRFYRALGSE